MASSRRTPSTSATARLVDRDRLAGQDELAGAARVGMTPALILPDGYEPFWPDAHAWDGLRVRSIPEVLELV